MSGTKERRESKAKAAPAGTATDSPAKASPARTKAESSGAVGAGTARRSSEDTAPADNVRTRELVAQEQMGAGILAVMFALDEAAKDDGRVPKMVQAAKLFLIAVIFIAPVLLMWQHAF
ncbi:MAG: hypothetical protein ACXIU8_10960 [Alkalilacustris sp.]